MHHRASNPEKLPVEPERYIEYLETALEQLRRQVAAADMASLARSEFLAALSHQIRRSMTGILGFSEQLELDRLNEVERSIAIKAIRRNARYLMSVIEDLMDLSSIEAGRLEIDHRECSPLTLLREVRGAVEPRLRSRGLRLEMICPGDLPETIQTDAGRLRQILVNVLDFAIIATPEGSVHMAVQFSEEGMEPALHFEIRDSGPGMTAEEVEALFDPFLAGRLGGSFPGLSPLGLSLSKRLAILLEGDLRVESTPGTGSTYRLSVATGPLDGVNMVSGAALIAMVEETVEQAGANMPPTAPLSARVLLVEDDADSRRLVRFLLTKAGAEVAVAADGQAAVEMAWQEVKAGRPYDVILMDMQMPVMDGYAATSLLRRRGYTHPIIALTAHALAGDREKCLAAGCDEYLVKPIDRHSLLETVRRWLSRSSAGSPGMAASTV